MRYWYDCEFIDNGKTIDLISIGIVSEDGREYYAQCTDFGDYKASEWVKQNVFPHLSLCPNMNCGGLLDDKYRHSLGTCSGRICREVPHCPWRTHDQIGHDITTFMYGDRNIELWGYYSAYDHVAFCQTFGLMEDLPDGYPHYTRDLRQFADMLGIDNLPQKQEAEHNALADARWNKRVWEFLYPIWQAL